MLEGRTVIITGAGKGLGLASTIAMSDAGARVIAVDVDEAALASLAVERPSVVPIRADVSDPLGADEIVAAAGAQLDILVNNAAVLDGLAQVDEMPEARWNRVIAVNLTGPFLLAKRVVPVMAARGGGVIINVASIAGIRGGRAGAAYTASKHALVGLTLNMAATLGTDGIRTIALCPGGMYTGMDRGGEVSAKANRIVGRDRLRPTPATPEEIAPIVTMLASDASLRMNGAIVTADGGASAY